MRITLFILALCTLGISQVNAQEYYKSAAGLRLGYPVSVSYKTFINDNAAVEAYIGFRSYSYLTFSNYSSVSIAAAYQIHNPIDEVDGLQWYYGGGASIVFNNYPVGLDNFSSLAFGISGYLGLDYKFNDLPVAVSLDWVPTLFLGNTTYNSFGAGYGSLGVRYILSE